MQIARGVYFRVFNKNQILLYLLGVSFLGINCFFGSGAGGLICSFSRGSWGSTSSLDLPGLSSPTLPELSFNFLAEFPSRPDPRFPGDPGF